MKNKMLIKNEDSELRFSGPNHKFQTTSLFHAGSNFQNVDLHVALQDRGKQMFFWI